VNIHIVVHTERHCNCFPSVDAAVDGNMLVGASTAALSVVAVVRVGNGSEAAGRVNRTAAMVHAFGA